MRKQLFNVSVINYSMYYNVFLSNLCTVLEEAVSRDAVEGVIYGDIGDTIIAFFETVYRSPDGRSRSCDIEHREKDTYSTPTFTVEIRQSGS